MWVAMIEDLIASAMPYAAEVIVLFAVEQLHAIWRAVRSHGLIMIARARGVEVRPQAQSYMYYPQTDKSPGWDKPVGARASA